MHTRRLLSTLGALSLAAALAAEEPAPKPVDNAQRLEALEKKLEAVTFALDAVTKKVDDLLWFQRAGDVAEIDKVYIPTVPNPKGKEIYGISTRSIRTRPEGTASTGWTRRWPARRGGRSTSSWRITSSGRGEKAPATGVTRAGV